MFLQKSIHNVEHPTRRDDRGFIIGGDKTINKFRQRFQDVIHEEWNKTAVSRPNVEGVPATQKVIECFLCREQEGVE